MDNKRIWALTDGRPGNDNQTIAVAGELGKYTVKRITFNKWATLPNLLLGTSSIGIDTKLDEPYPDVIIATGRKLSRVARIIKKNSKAKIIQLMWPEHGVNDFDLIFAPEHDQLSPRKNLISTVGAANRVRPDMLAAEVEKWCKRIPSDNLKFAAVLVGDIDDEEARLLVSHINSMSPYPLITTSRRTSASVIEILKTRIERERYLYEWKPETENPYYGFLGLADFIITTEDSISMMAESCTTGKPVYIMQSAVPKKHKLFSKSLFDAKLARPLLGSTLEVHEYQPLNTLQFITRHISERI